MYVLVVYVYPNTIVHPCQTFFIPSHLEEELSIQYAPMISDFMSQSQIQSVLNSLPYLT